MNYAWGNFHHTLSALSRGQVVQVEETGSAHTFFRQEYIQRRRNSLILEGGEINVPVIILSHDHILIFMQLGSHVYTWPFQMCAITASKERFFSANCHERRKRRATTPQHHMTTRCRLMRCAHAHTLSCCCRMCLVLMHAALRLLPFNDFFSCTMLGWGGAVMQYPLVIYWV